ncbi:MAG: hypothetical protein OEY34_09910 [Cyclobacteriaceae bacterium]|nr:hypothetical protein [Cyclobacteriaceae bacterium]
MKITGFFKTGKHQRFHYEPRHFNPDAEEARKRERRIRMELKLEDGENSASDSNTRYHSSIQGAFIKRRYVNSAVNKTSNIRILVIILIMLGLLYGWWEIGNDVIYSLLLLVPFYVYLRLKRKI